MNIRAITKVYADLEKCAEHWHATLLSERGGSARRYALDRLPKSFVISKKLGVCYDFPEDCLDSLTITGNKKRSKKNPTFWGRLVIPILDAGYTVGFGARNLKQDDFSKYINSPESEFYQKSGTLYNLWEARKEIHKLGFAILVEGYFDVLGLEAVGIKNVVAGCGTAFAQRQAEKLAYFTDTVVTWYDGDKPGVEAAKKAKKLLGSQGFSVSILKTPGLDPFDASKKFSVAKLKTKIEESME